MRYAIRHSTPNDLPAMQEMFAHSKSIMRADGNLQQWTGEYPTREQLLDDMRQGHGYIMEADEGTGRAVGTFALILGLDPTYSSIEEGAWTDNDVPYGTIHRLACAPLAHGIAEACFDFCDRHAPSLRIDTHADNHIMQHLAKKHGFQYSGIIHIADGTSRLAYQRLLPRNVCQELIDYCEKAILPRYDAFDEAHQQPHIRSDIRRALEMAERYQANKNILYCAAAYHDIGCCESRELHHIVSGRIVREDKNLLRFFSPLQIETIAQAAEDHRASARQTPRSLYGIILAEADRDLSPELVVRRTVQYGLAQHPEATKEQIFQRTLQHLQEKYGPSGYLKLLLPDSPNQADLERLRGIIANKMQLKGLFERIFAKESQERKTAKK